MTEPKENKRFVRFHVGPAPKDPDFDPSAGGWRKLREPGAERLLAVSVLAGIVLAALVALLWYLLIQLEPPTSGFAFAISLPALLGAIFAITAFVCLHELLHVLPMAFVGRPGDVVIGFWPRNLAPYVAYLGTTSREVQVLSGVLPFLLLTALPFAVAFVLPASAPWMAGLSILNVLGSAADLIMLALLITQVPKRALIRNQGFETWWRPAA